ncbi:Scr1 family TA system antitoxin-like transcriptional regulator [Gordonia sp. (in: high G+C Gram-positive bacteria)]|uniref:Scr1 family TA system antitoxin-like transcriptional regulator n=1 Tax=Gordonia sp. (in: high G+C Gram-positive bacteria) TaxID=84139 RepID=UPI0034527463
MRLVDARAVTHRSTARLHRRDSERDYAHAILHACTAITGGRDDLDEAVHMRIVRQLVLQRGGHRFHILIGEAALHRTVGDGAVMAAQLEHLRGELDRPNVRLGVITPDAAHRGPYDERHRVRPQRGAHRDRHHRTDNHPAAGSEIALHEKTFASGRRSSRLLRRHPSARPRSAGAAHMRDPLHRDREGVTAHLR